MESEPALSKILGILKGKKKEEVVRLSQEKTVRLLADNIEEVDIQNMEGDVIGKGYMFNSISEENEQWFIDPVRGGKYKARGLTEIQFSFYAIELKMPSSSKDSSGMTAKEFFDENEYINVFTDDYEFHEGLLMRIEMGHEDKYVIYNPEGCFTRVVKK